MTKNRCGAIDLGQAQKDLDTARRKRNRAETILIEAEKSFNEANEEYLNASRSFDRAVQAVRSK